MAEDGRRRDRVCVFAGKTPLLVGTVPIWFSRAFRSLLSFSVMAALGILAHAGPVEAQGFAAPVLVPTGNQPVFVATADVNGDGIPDLIYIDAGATETASTTHVLLGDGKGGFAQSAVLQTAGTVVAFGNLSDGGHVDIGWVYLAPTPAGPDTALGWTIAPGVGDGTFGTPTPKALSGGLFSNSASLQIISVDASNLNHRAVTSPEIVGIDAGSGYFFEILLDPTAVTGSSQPLIDGVGPLTIADLNGDGIDDYLINGARFSIVETFLGAPSTGGPLLKVPNPPVFSGTSGVRSLLIKDFNGDGRPDMAAEGASGRIDVYAGNGDGTFQTSPFGGTMSPDDSAGDGGHLVAAADVDGDGILDLLAYTSLGVSVELGSANGNYTLQGVYRVGARAGANGQFVTADFNGDGALDVALDAPGGIEILYGKAASAPSACLAPAGLVLACPEPSAFEGAFTFSATVPGGSSAGGTVTFSIAGSQSYETQAATLGTAQVVNGTATLTVTGKPLTGSTPIIPGTYAVTAGYLAANSALALNLPGTHTISLAPTTVTLTPAPPSTTLASTYFYGQGVNGYVYFNTLDPAYPATGTWTQLSNGVGVPGCIDLSVTAAGGSECPYGYPTLLDAGNYVFTEAYNGGPANGDPINASSVSSPYAFTVLPDATTVSALTSSLNPAPAGTAVTFTVTLTGNAAVPIGTVRFSDGATVIGSATLNAAGQASFTTSTLTVGTHPITAFYAGTLDFNGVTSAVLDQVIQAVPLTSAVSLTSSLNPSIVGQPVTFTAAVSVPGPMAYLVQSGTVTFLDGTGAIGTGTIDQNGRTTLTTASLAVGSHPITASYAGGKSANGETVAPGVSAVLTQVVNSAMRTAPPGFSLTVTPNPVQLKPGSTAVELVTVTETSGFSQAVTLSCTGANSSNELSCGFLEGVIPAGGGTTTLDVVTTAPYPCGGGPTKPYGVAQVQTVPGCGVGSPAGAKMQGIGWRTLAAGGAMIAGLLWIWPRRTRRWARLLAVMMLAGVAGLSGCGNCSNLGTRPGNYQITVAGTAGSVTESVVLKIKVLDP